MTSQTVCQLISQPVNTMAFDFFQCLYFVVVHAVHMHWTGRPLILLICIISISHDCKMNIHFSLNERTSVCIKLGSLCMVRNNVLWEVMSAHLSEK
jgi:hypothetical protein